VRPCRYIISGGGTGGHIYPAIAIAQEIRRREPEAEILFVGAQDRMEMQKVPKAGFVIKGLWIAGFKRRLTLKNLWVPLKLMVSLLQSFYWIKWFKPHVVVGTGGFASGPLLRVAGMLGIPTLIQEQNSYAGMTNKLLSAKASKICVAYHGMEQFFPAEKLVLTGNPVRQDLISHEADRGKASSDMGLTHNTDMTLLILGGSLGALRINELVATQLDFFETQNLNLIWQCGAHYFETYKAYSTPRVKVMAFIEHMAKAYAAADLIISRSGALSVSELALVGKPVLFIPSPNVAENHQVKNAQALVDQGAAIMIQEPQLDRDFKTHFMRLLEDAQMRASLSKAIKGMAREGATREIVDEIQKLTP